MKASLLIILFLIPVMGLITGLSVATTVVLFSVICLVFLRKKIEFEIREYKLETFFSVWILLSSLWSISSIDSFFSGTKFIAELFMGLILIKNINKVEIDVLKVNKILMLAFSVAIVAFFFEYFTSGYLSVKFREVAQKKDSHFFFLYNLDRGVALLSMFSWLVIGVLLQKNHRTCSIFVYCLILSVLYLSDNLAAFVGYIVAASVFFLTKINIFKNPKILAFLLFLGSILMLIFAFRVDALKIAEENKILPLSAKHRLFIWHFVADNSQAKLWQGIGFNSSKIFPVNENQVVNVFDHNLHPLPMHPHNNILQVYFELGVIGLILYLSLICKYLIIISQRYRSVNNSATNVIYACFSLYFIIAMISYNMWQTWFVASAIWIAALFKWVLSSGNEPHYLHKPFMQVSPIK